MNDTVADETTTAAQPTATDQGAQDRPLDEILSEIDQDFDKGTKVPGSQTKDDPVAELKSQVEYLVSQTTEADIDKAVESVSKVLGDVQVPKRAIRGMLNDMAIEDPRVRKAFENRHRDSAGWNKVLKAAAKNIRDEFSGLPDKRLTDDREAVAATIRGASKTTVEDDAPNFKTMSDQEFEAWKRKHY